MKMLKEFMAGRGNGRLVGKGAFGGYVYRLEDRLIPSSSLPGAEIQASGQTALALFSRILLGLLILAGCMASPAWARQQELPAAIAGARGIPEDWSSHRLMFSRPSSPQALRKLEQEPRYWFQQFARDRLRFASAAEILDAKAMQIVHSWGHPILSKKPRLKGDWSQNLGTGAKVGAGMSPAKYSFLTSSASCTDFVVFNTGVSGSGTQASIGAFSNLYSGCTGSGTVPTTSWAFNTGGTVATSVTLSADGSQVAFVQSSSSSVASLVVLKWKSGSGTFGGPTALTSQLTGTAYRNCTAPCMYTIAFNGSPNDSISAPFYDYNSDTIYVGDNAGLLHKFTGVFNGAPAEVTSSPWPVTVVSSSLLCGSGTNACLTLSSPVYDSTSGKIFVGNGVTVTFSVFFSGGALSAVTASTGAVASTSQLGNGTGIADSPVVDSGAGRVYAFLGNDGSSNCGSSQACSAVYQFTTGLSGQTETTVGTGHATSGAITLYDGSFDNTYFSSGNPSSPSGNLYVCGNTAGNATLYRIPITTNTMGSSSSAMPTALSTANTTCSEVTEIFNSPTDWIFLSVQAAGNPNGNVDCPVGGGGCVMSFNVSSGATPTATFAAVGEAGGTSSIIVDNTVPSGTLMGASQVYFSTLSNGTCGTSGTGGCGVQASQSGLN